VSAYLSLLRDRLTPACESAGQFVAASVDVCVNLGNVFTTANAVA
jgi:hypothetical protein